MRRSNVMVLLGAAFFVLGGAIVLLVLRDDAGTPAGATPAAATGPAPAAAAASQAPAAAQAQAQAPEDIEIPEGMEVVAVQVDFVAGGAGYVAPGDRVNLWAVIEKTTPLDESNQPTGPGFAVPRTDLLLNNVEVLDVSAQVAPHRAADDPDAPRVGTDQLTYLLAVDTVSASRAIFATSFNRMYVTLVRDDARPTLVPGVEYGNLR